MKKTIGKEKSNPKMQLRHTKIREETKLHSKGRKKKAKDVQNGKRYANAGKVDPQENGDRLNGLG